jgi:hypothetical protein
MRRLFSVGYRTLARARLMFSTPIGRVCVVVHSRNVKLHRRTARAFAIEIYRCFTGPDASSPDDRIGPKILRGRNRRYGNRIWIDRRWDFACHHRRRERHRLPSEHQVHVDQHLAEIDLPVPSSE